MKSSKDKVKLKQRETKNNLRLSILTLDPFKALNKIDYYDNLYDKIIGLKNQLKQNASMSKKGIEPFTEEEAIEVLKRALDIELDKLKKFNEDTYE